MPGTWQLVTMQVYSVRRSVTVLIIAAALVLYACQPQARGKPPELMVLEGGTHVVHHESQGRQELAYELVAVYPAAAVIEQISDRLSKLGWVPITHDWLNPTVPSAHERGWTFFYDVRKGAPIGIHKWAAQWRDKTGNVVAYSFEYASPASNTRERMPSPSDVKLHVAAMYVPAEIARAVEGATR